MSEEKRKERKRKEKDSPSLLILVFIFRRTRLRFQFVAFTASYHRRTVIPPPIALELICLGGR